MGKKEIAIKVDNLSIRYKSLKSFSIKQNFLRFHKNKRETFEALKNISFEVEEGEISWNHRKKRQAGTPPF